MKKIKTFYKIILSLLLIVLTISLFSCKSNILPNADIRLNDKTEYFIDKVNLYFDVIIKNNYKIKESDNIYITYTDIYNTKHKDIKAEKKDNTYFVEVINLGKNEKTNITFKYEYEPNKARIVKEDFIITAKGNEYDDGEIIEISSYETYYSEARQNQIDESQNPDLKIRKKYKLTKDIDFKNKPFLPLANNFIGAFFGNNKKLTNITDNKMTISEKLNDKEKITIKNRGLFTNILGDAYIKDLIIDNLHFKNYDNNTNILNNDSFNNDPFGIIASRAFKNTKIENITIKNSTVDILVFPGYTSFNTAKENANFSLLVGFSSGIIKDIKIDKATLNIKNYGACGLGCGLLLGKTNEISEISMINIKGSTLNFSSFIDPFRLSGKKFELANGKISYETYFEGLNDINNFTQNVGLLIGESKSTPKAVYLSNNNISYNELENEFLTCFLMGDAISFDYKDLIFPNDKVESIIYPQNARNYKLGDMVRIYLNLNKINLKNNPLPIFKRLFVNNFEQTSSIRQLPGSNGIYYYDFKITENTFIYSNTTYQEDEIITINNNINTDYEIVNPDLDENKRKFPHINIPYLKDMVFKITNPDLFKTNYLMVKYFNKSFIKDDNNITPIMTYFTKVRDDHTFIIPAISNSYEITFLKKPKERINIGQVLGKGTSLEYAYLENNIINNRATCKNLTKPNRNILFDKINIGIYSGEISNNDTSFNIKNTVTNSFNILSNITDEEYINVKQIYPNQNNDNLFYSKPIIFSIAEDIKLFKDYEYFNNLENLEKFFSSNYKDFFNKIIN